MLLSSGVQWLGQLNVLELKRFSIYNTFGDINSMYIQKYLYTHSMFMIKTKKLNMPIAGNNVENLNSPSLSRVKEAIPTL